MTQPATPYGSNVWPDHISFTERIKEIDRFFQGKDRVHDTMRRVAAKLESAGVAYVVVGGMAVHAHGHQQTTGDVDFLMMAEGREAFCQEFVGRDFDAMPGRPRRFVDRANGITFDILVT